MNNSTFHACFNNLNKEFHSLIITMIDKFVIPPSAEPIEPMQGVIDLFGIESKLSARIQKVF